MPKIMITDKQLRDLNFLNLNPIIWNVTTGDREHQI